MIDKKFWEKIAKNWSKEDDGIVIPDDKQKEFTKAKEITEDDLTLFDDTSHDEIDDILSELGLDID